MTKYKFRCIKCGEEFQKEFDDISEAIKNHGTHSTNGCGGLVRYDDPGSKYGKIKKSTCTSCPDKDECSQLPELLAVCQLDAFEYRLKTGKFGLTSGAGAKELPKDINGVIIDGTPVYLEDIKQLFIARWDTYSLYPANYTGKEDVPQTYEPPTDDVILRALMCHITIGFLPHDPKIKAGYKWICYDVDKKHCIGTIYESNPRKAVDEIVKNLKEWYNLTGYIELSGSPDGYHIWVFIEPTDRELVYKFDGDFKARCDPSLNKTIDKRVEKGNGRMIKLPYTINLKNGVRGKFVDGVDLHKIQLEKLPIIK